MPTKAPTVPPTVAPTVAPTKAATAAVTAAPTAAVKTWDLTVTLKKGIKWSDGTDFTTKDILGTYNVYWAQSGAAWTYITDIKVVDPLVITFTLNNVSITPIRTILKANQLFPYSQYGKWMDQAGELRKAATDRKGDVVKKYLEELYAFKPADAVVNGPYKIDPKTVTEAQLTLKKNPTGYNADKIGFDTLTMFFGETTATVPLVLAGQIDYSTHGFTPANIKAFGAMPEIKIIYGPTGTGPGFWFNQNNYPNSVKEFRQAIAYVIDRDENGKVSLDVAGKGIKYMAGFTDAAVETWLSKEAIAKLNPYKKDLKKADELLAKVNFKKGADGFYVDDKGKKIELELSVPSDFADWFASAENAAQQLNKFGIKSTVRGYQSSERATVQSDGKYNILVDLAIYYNPPNPRTSFNYYLNAPRNNPNKDGKPAGFNWSWTQKGPDGKEVNIPDLLAAAIAGTDVAAQRKAIETLSLLVNEELPVISFFERYSNDPINTKTVTGWLPLEDKIYKNNQTDNYVGIQLLDGTLKPAGDKDFSSAYPYPQPPKGHYNVFATDNLPLGIGNPFQYMEYPPLFWYMWADNNYVPVLAEKFELK